VMIASPPRMPGSTPRIVVTGRLHRDAASVARVECHIVRDHVMILNECDSQAGWDFRKDGVCNFLTKVLSL
jgi:hypothetical protein